MLKLWTGVHPLARTPLNTFGRAKYHPWAQWHSSFQNDHPHSGAGKEIASGTMREFPTWLRNEERREPLICVRCYIWPSESIPKLLTQFPEPDLWFLQLSGEGDLDKSHVPATSGWVSYLLMGFLQFEARMCAIPSAGIWPNISFTKCKIVVKTQQ